MEVDYIRFSVLNWKGSCQKPFFKIITILYAAANFISCGHPATCQPFPDYSPLIEFIRLEDKSTPVYAFNDFTERFDKKSHKTALHHLNSRKGLIKKIKKDLGAHNLAWRLESFEQRLLYVPETRQEYAELYERYCHDVIEFILKKTELDNPYANIETLERANPEIPKDGGVTVFLVHNLATEYVGNYSFFNDSRPKEIKISLRGRNFLGEIGSYSSMLVIKEGGAIEFERNRYTIWQNSAKSPYNALIVPIEETLHIALRPYTEEAIRQQLSSLGKAANHDIEKIVEHWMSIEEAAVGGMVDIFFSQVVHAYIHKFPPGIIEKSLNEKFHNKRYRYLPKGIEVVKSMGVKAAIDMYSRNPGEFRARVITDAVGAASI